MTSTSLENRITKALRRLKDDILESEPPVDYFADDPGSQQPTVIGHQYTHSNTVYATSYSYATASTSSGFKTTSGMSAGGLQGWSQNATLAADPEVLEIKPALTIECKYCGCAGKPSEKLCSQCGAPLNLAKDTDEEFRRYIFELIDEIKNG